MAIYLLGPPFTATNPAFGNTNQYQPYYDTGTSEVKVYITGDQGPDANAVTEEVRGFPDNFSFGYSCDGTTKIEGYSSTTSPFATVDVTEDSEFCQYTPPGETCDLIINSIQVTDETSLGANDGTLTVNASSTHTPIEYSLNNATWQSSNYFTGIAPGNYFVYLRDDLTCVTQTNFGVIAYNVPVQNFSNDLPIVTDGGNISRWSAVFNPIYITYQRSDFDIVTIKEQNENQIKVELPFVLSGDQIGQALNGNSYIKSSLYEIYSKALSHTVVSGKSVLVFNQLYLGDDTGGVININLYKPGYAIETEITFGDNAYNRKVINAVHSPDYKGITRADISSFLRTQLSAKDNYNYIDASFKDTNLAQSYTIRFREVWDTSQSEWFSAPYPLYFNYAAMQLGERYGGNMIEYVPFMTVSAPSKKAKFLTDWKEPRMWGGFPFEVSFIYSENVINEQLFIELTPDCGEQTNSFLLNADAGYLLDADSGRFIIGSEYNPEVTGFQLIQALGVNRVLIPDIFDCCTKNIKANIYYESGEDKIYIMQDLNIKYNCACDEPFVYIKWINSRGAWDYYRFAYNQKKNALVSTDDSVSRFVENWETSDTIEDNISKSSIQYIQVGADNISEDEAKTLQWARKSIKAMMMVSNNPVKWRTVIIQEGDTDIIQTRKPNSSSVRMTLLLPSDNIQAQ